MNPDLLIFLAAIVTGYITTAVLVAMGVRGVQVVVKWRGETSAERKAAAKEVP